MRGEYKISIPLEDKETKPRMTARAWRRYWKNLIFICKSLKRSGIRYEVEYHFGAEMPYALIFAGDACRQGALRLAA